MTNVRIALVLALILGACGDKSCEELCEEAQAGDCTSVNGNCGTFCSALDTVEGPSNCADERSTYESCLNGTDAVCDANCDSQESALSSCIQAYCIGHTNDAACVTLATSF
jgi:hypothetical protein